MKTIHFTILPTLGLVSLASCGSPDPSAKSEPNETGSGIDDESVADDDEDSQETTPDTGVASSSASVDGQSDGPDETFTPDSSTSSSSSSEPVPRESFVDFVAVYEPGSAWEGSSTAKEAVEKVFAELEATIKTSGDWDTKIEVFFTDNNTQNANVRFNEAYSVVEYEGRQLKVVPAWKKIVLNEADENGFGSKDGSSADFIMHFNVKKHTNNPGLVRHEVMHGLGAVSTLVRPVMDKEGNMTRKPIVGQRWIPGPYELRLVDQDGESLFEDYDPATQTYAIRDFKLSEDIEAWKTGGGGLSFRGIDDQGQNFDMPCMSFPDGDTGENERIRYEEPQQLMSAGSHPTWHSLDLPDRAFLRGMMYELRSQ